MMHRGTALDLARARLGLSISNGREKQSSSFSSAQQGATFVFSELDEELKHVSGMSGEIQTTHSQSQSLLLENEEERQAID